MPAITNLIARGLLAQIFLFAGLSKLADYGGTQAWMEAMEVSGDLLPLVIALELAGAAALILGWQTRWAALALAAFSVVSGLLFHADFGDQTQSILFMKNLAMAGGLLLLVAHGPGALSLDQRRATSARHSGAVT